MKKPGKKASATNKRPGQLSEAAAKKFLAAYKEAWETRNPEVAASLFTRDAHYWENPFGKPVVGREAIGAYWKAATESQEAIQFRIIDFHRARYTLVAVWTCTYTHRPTGERRELAGALLADFYGQQVRSFREYWHSRTL